MVYLITYKFLYTGHAASYKDPRDIIVKHTYSLTYKRRWGWGLIKSKPITTQKTFEGVRSDVEYKLLFGLNTWIKL